jgi:hypothetical protein
MSGIFIGRPLKDCSVHEGQRLRSDSVSRDNHVKRRFDYSSATLQTFAWSQRSATYLMNPARLGRALFQRDMEANVWYTIQLPSDSFAGEIRQSLTQNLPEIWMKNRIEKPTEWWAYVTWSRISITLCCNVHQLWSLHRPWTYEPACPEILATPLLFNSAYNWADHLGVL